MIYYLYFLIFLSFVREVKSQEIKLDFSGIRIPALFAIVFISAGSLWLNRNLGSATEDIIINYSVSFFPIFISLTFQDIQKKVRYTIGIFGLIWFIYIALHYLVGFHNPYWGN